MDAMNEKNKANICLFCTEPECIGDEQCFQKHKKIYIRNYHASRRAAERILDAAYNKSVSEQKRIMRNQAIAKHRKEVQHETV